MEICLKILLAINIHCAGYRTTAAERLDEYTKLCPPIFAQFSNEGNFCNFSIFRYGVKYSTGYKTKSQKVDFFNLIVRRGLQSIYLNIIALLIVNVCFQFIFGFILGGKIVHGKRKTNSSAMEGARCSRHLAQDKLCNSSRVFNKWSIWTERKNA